MHQLSQYIGLNGGGGTGVRLQRGPCFSGGSIVRTVANFGLNGNDGSDVVKGQQDDDSIQGHGQNDDLYGGNGDDCLGQGCTSGDTTTNEPGNDFLKTKDHASGNDLADGGANTDTCRIDAGDEAISCEL